MKKRFLHGQQGQAIVEMTCGLIGLLSLFSALMVFAVLGAERVSTIVQVRNISATNIAGNDGDAINSPGGVSVAYWDNGPDNLHFTPDDTAVTGEAGAASTFSNELTIDLSAYSYVENNEFDTLPAANLFLSLARLREFTLDSGNPLRSSETMSGAETAFRILFDYRGDFSVSESHFMYDSIAD
jgi:hypothetical protein